MIWNWGTQKRKVMHPGTENNSNSWSVCRNHRWWSILGILGSCKSTRSCQWNAYVKDATVILASSRWWKSKCQCTRYQLKFPLKYAEKFWSPFFKNFNWERCSEGLMKAQGKREPVFWIKFFCLAQWHEKWSVWWLYPFTTYTVFFQSE